MAASNWTEVDLTLFKGCQESLGYDEILYSPQFDIESLMRAMVIGNPKIDSHMICNGISSVKDLFDAGFTFNDAELTDADVLAISGYLIDCQVSRLNGQIIYLNELTAVFLHKEFQLKNELLRVVAHSFSAAFCAVEKFANEALKGTYFTVWSPCDQYDKYMLEGERDLVSKYVPSSKEAEQVLSLCKMELELAQFLESDFSSPVPSVPELPLESKDMGFSQLLHYRDLSVTTPPAKPQIPAHEEACRELRSFLQSLHDVIAFDEKLDIKSLFSSVHMWSVNNRDALALLRLILYRRIFPIHSANTYFGTKTIEQFIVADFMSYNAPQSLIDFPDFKSLCDTHLLSFIQRTVSIYLGHPQTAHGMAEKAICEFWGYIQLNLIDINTRIKDLPILPKVNSRAFTETMNIYLLFWSEFIAIDIAERYLYDGFISNIFNDADVPGLMTVSRSMFELRALCLEKTRLFEVIFRLSSKRKGKKHPGIIKVNDIQREMKPKSAEEFLNKALAAYSYGCFYFTQFAMKNSFLSNSNEFYNPEQVYANRIAPIAKMTSMNLMSSKQYIHEVGNADRKTLHENAMKLFTEAKAFIKQANEVAKGSGDEILKKIIMTSLVMSKWKDGDRVEFRYDGNVPVFALIPSNCSK